jgi:hypothetical protein
MSCDEARIAYLRVGRALFEDAGSEDVRLVVNGRERFASELEGIFGEKIRETERSEASDVDKEEAQVIFCHVSLLFRD